MPTPPGCVAWYCGSPLSNTPLSCALVADGGALGVRCRYQKDYYPDASCGFGRRPEGLAAIEGPQGAPLGVFFANTSYLEAASVDAFLTLHDELAAHGAPPELLAQARRAAGDEVRHARGAAALARRFGVLPGDWAVRPKITPPAPRSLEEIARENAVEGCVQETWGALTGLWAADRAEDPEVRRVLRAHAPDEVRHAELAWSVAAWAHGALDDDARRRVEAAMHDAADGLVADVARHEPHPDVVARAGIPSAGDAVRLASVLRSQLWLGLALAPPPERSVVGTKAPRSEGALVELTLSQRPRRSSPGSSSTPRCPG